MDYDYQHVVSSAAAHPMKILSIQNFFYLQTSSIRLNPVNSSVHLQRNLKKDKVVGESQCTWCSSFCKCHFSYPHCVIFFSYSQREKRLKKTQQDNFKKPKQVKQPGTGFQMDREIKDNNITSERCERVSIESLL